MPEYLGVCIRACSIVSGKRTSLKPPGSLSPSAAQVAYGYTAAFSGTVAQSHIFFGKI